MSTRFNPRSGRGFSLIEVLAAVLVLAVGIVGAGAAQVTALKTRHGTGLMSSAVQLAGTLAERMRANPAQMQAGDVANPYLHAGYDAAGGAPAAPTSMCYAGASCTSAQMAAFDIYELRQALYRQYPGARMVVCRDGAMWDDGERALSWQCTGGPDAPVVIKLGWRTRNSGGGGPFAPVIGVLVGGAFQ